MARPGCPGDAGDYTTARSVAGGINGVKRFLATLIVLILLGGGLMLPSGDSEGGATAVVQRGDTLGKLAKTHGVTVQDLRALNDLDGDLIQVGQERDKTIYTAIRRVPWINVKRLGETG